MTYRADDHEQHVEDELRSTFTADVQFDRSSPITLHWTANDDRVRVKMFGNVHGSGLDWYELLEAVLRLAHMRHRALADIAEQREEAGG